MLNISEIPSVIPKALSMVVPAGNPGGTATYLDEITARINKR